LVSDALDRKLSWVERIEVKIHLSMCSLCSSYAKNVSMMHDIFSMIRNSDEEKNSQIPENTKQKIKKVLHEQCDDKS